MTNRIESVSTQTTLWQVPVPHNNEAQDSFSPIHLNLPVGLASYINIVHVSGVVLWICPTQYQLSSHCCFWVSE